MLDEKKCGILIMLDLSAAFDTVVHRLLIEDLKLVGVEGDALQYMESYLSNREYCVQIGRKFSERKILERGVPQGSILGPLLFCIYTRELASLLEELGVQFRLFADDTQIYLTFINVDVTSRIINEVLRRVKEWMDKKQLRLNENKTEFMVFSSKGNQEIQDIKNILVSGNPIQLAECVRDLGVLIDSGLTFVPQISDVVKKTSYCLRNIAFVRKYIDIDSIKKLVVGGVLSRLDYCNSVYFRLPAKQLRRL